MTSELDSNFSARTCNKDFTISLWLERDAIWSGEEPVGFGVLGFSTWGAKNLKISVLPNCAAKWSGVHPTGVSNMD